MTKFDSKLKNELYETLVTIAGCTIVALAIIYLRESDDPHRPLRVFIISYTYGLAIQFSGFFWHQYYPTKNFLHRYIIPSLIGYIAATLLILGFFRWQKHLAAADLSDFLFQTLTYALLASLVFMYYVVVGEQKQAMRSELKAAQLAQEKNEKQLLQSKLRLLQSQIEPHFLFNTLANIRALVKIDAEKSEALLDNLTALLRQSLKQTRDEVNTLKTEIDFCNSYLSIQQIRIGDRLNITFEISDDVDLDQPFPPLLLLPIVENAIQHGIEPMSSESNLHVKIERRLEQLLITVSDDGIGLGNSKHSGHGVGLSNIRSRIKSLFGDIAKLDVFSNEHGGVTVTLATPPLSDALVFSPDE